MGGVRFPDGHPDAGDLARFIGGQQIDVLVVGPVTAVGFEQRGTIQEVREFMNEVQHFRQQTGRRLSTVLVHHENKGGTISGAFGARATRSCTRRSALAHDHPRDRQGEVGEPVAQGRTQARLDGGRGLRGGRGGGAQPGGRDRRPPRREPVAHDARDCRRTREGRDRCQPGIGRGHTRDQPRPVRKPHRSRGEGDRSPPERDCLEPRREDGSSP